MLARFDKNAHRKGEVSLDPILTVLDRLGRPQDKFPPVIHIAGTNGKGSTAAFVRAMAEAADLRVHVSTSPHLVRINERIRLAGSLIGDEPLLHYAECAAAASEGLTVSYFELTFAAACLAFADVPGDLLVLEVGLGGRMDASNVIDQPAVSVITPIALDHQAILGRGLAQIAWKKAGIIKAVCPVVCAMQDAEALGVISEEAFALGAPLHVLTPEEVAAAPSPRGLLGDHQMENAALAAKALTVWGDQRITPEAIGRGAAMVRWPARMQRLVEGPVTALAGGAEVWLDGGHNPHAARAIGAALKPLDGPAVLIASMMSNKDAQGFFEGFERPCTVQTFGGFGEGHAMMPADELAAHARAAGLTAGAHDTFEAAMQAGAADGPARFLICGSLYSAGEVLSRNEQVPD